MFVHGKRNLLWQIILGILCIILFTTTRSFSANIDHIKAAIEVNGAEWTAQENLVSQLQPEELKNMLGAMPELDLEAPVDKSFDVPLTLPSKFDWRNHNGNYVTPVKNQGGTRWQQRWKPSCGSCWAFATTAALESKALITFNWPDFNLNLSEQIVISCSGAGACDGGWAYKASDFLKNTGTSLEGCYPYTASNGNCHSACANWWNSTFKFESWSYVVNGGNASVTAVKNAIYTTGPVVARMRVYEDFQHYHSGVYSYLLGNYISDHSVLVVGWDDLNNAFICKNSWGTDWGESGFFRIAYSELQGASQFGFETIAYGNAVSAFPDLVITSINGPSSGVISDQISVSATVYNQGSSEAGPFSLGLYFSADPNSETGDILFASCNYPSGLGPRTSNTCSGSVTVPPMRPGTYYLGAIADDQSGVAELYKDNNSRVGGIITLTTAPQHHSTPVVNDLTGSWTVPVTQTCGKTSRHSRCTLKGTFTINNMGNKDASSAYVHFYLSDNGNYGGGDTPLRSFSTGKIKAGNSKAMRLSFNFPSGQTATGEYIIAVIDNDNLVMEIDKTNNVIVFGPIQ